jgi:hypothetical protein
MSSEERKKIGLLGREHVLKNYNYEDYGNAWTKILEEVYDKYGSWNTRKCYKGYSLTEVFSENLNTLKRKQRQDEEYDENEDEIIFEDTCENKQENSLNVNCSLLEQTSKGALENKNE